MLHNYDIKQLKATLSANIGQPWSKSAQIILEIPGFQYKEIHLMLQSFSKHQSSANLWSVNMPVIEILNPQDPIPEVKSVYTALKGVEVQVDLNEDSWARDYFIIFFHTGPNDPVSTSILRYSLHSLRTLLMSLLLLSWAWWWCSGVSMLWTIPSPARWSPT